MADRVYVPGFGYVTGGSGTSGGSSNYASGRTVGNGSQRGAAKEAALKDSDPSNDPVVNPTMPKPTTGVAFPLSGRGGFGELGGYAYGQRLGPNPDARELFPYGVAFRTEKDAINSFLELEPQYQLWLDNLAENPLIGTSGSTGRMLWERISGLAAERTAMGRPASPQQIAAEIANSIGVSPLEGRTEEIDWTSSGSSGSGSYGGGGGYSGGGSTSQRIDLTSYSGAQALLTQFMRSSMGRNPKVGEVKKFFELLQGYQKNNPTVVSASGNTVTQSGGIDPGIVAQDFVETLPDYTESQADRYYRVFMSALLGGGGSVSV